MYKKQAAERKKEGGKTFGRGRPKKVKENFPEPIPDAGDSRDKAGEAFGVSGKTVDAAKHVIDNGIPELAAAVDANEIAVSTAARASTLSDVEQEALVNRAKEEKEKGHRPREGKQVQPAPGDARATSAASLIRGWGLLQRGPTWG